MPFFRFHELPSVVPQHETKMFTLSIYFSKKGTKAEYSFDSKS